MEQHLCAGHMILTEVQRLTSNTRKKPFPLLQKNERVRTAVDTNMDMWNLGSPV